MPSPSFPWHGEQFVRNNFFPAAMLSKSSRGFLTTAWRLLPSFTAQSAIKPLPGHTPLNIGSVPRITSVQERSGTSPFAFFT